MQHKAVDFAAHVQRLLGSDPGVQCWYLVSCSFNTHQLGRLMELMAQQEGINIDLPKLALAELD